MWFTVEVQTSDDGRTWRAVAPAASVVYHSVNAEEVARRVIGSPGVVEPGSLYRVRVWLGPDVDTRREPAFVLDSATLRRQALERFVRETKVATGWAAQHITSRAEVEGEDQ